MGLAILLRIETPLQSFDGNHHRMNLLPFLLLFLFGPETDDPVYDALRAGGG